MNAVPLALGIAAASLAAVAIYRSRKAPALDYSNTSIQLPSLDFGLPYGDPLDSLAVFAQSTAEAIGLSQPRGVRNRNPGNVKRGPDRWRGLAPDGEQTDPVFWRFSDPIYGVRVIAYLLLGYQSRKGKRTVRQLISENGGWAPTGSADKNPAAYADFVARAAGVGVDQPINLATSPQLLRAIVVAIIDFENGGYSYPANIIDAGIAEART